MFSIFAYEFMQRAFLVGSIVAVLAPTLGVFIVAKRYSLLADTLAHVSLLGVAVAVVMGIHPLVGALVVAVGAGWGMERLRGTKQLFGESVLALFLSGSLALALILLAVNGGLNLNIFSYLFGSITTVSVFDVWLISGIGLVVAGIVGLYFRRFFAVAYDEELAQASGLPVTFLNVLLVTLAAATVALSLQVIGVLLIGALMVIPVLAGMQLGRSFFQTWVFSVVISFLAVVIGLIASFYLSLPSGAAIVAVTLVFFALSLIIRKK